MRLGFEQRREALGQVAPGGSGNGGSREKGGRAQQWCRPSRGRSIYISGAHECFLQKTCLLCFIWANIKLIFLDHRSGEGRNKENQRRKAQLARENSVAHLQREYCLKEASHIKYECYKSPGWFGT